MKTGTKIVKTRFFRGRGFMNIIRDFQEKKSLDSDDNRNALETFQYTSSHFEIRTTAKKVKSCEN